MEAALFDRMICLLILGIGIVLLGIARLCLRKLSFTRRSLATLAIAALVAAALYLSHLDANARLLTAKIGIPALLASALVQSTLAVRLSQLLLKPSIGGAVFIAVGVGLGAVAIVWYEREQDALSFDFEPGYELMNFKPPSSRVEGVQAWTDRGREIPINEVCTPRGRLECEAEERKAQTMLGRSDAIIRLKPAQDGTNCHGWVFTRGRYLVSGDAVESILQDNGYTATATPRVGDIAIYRDAADAVAHTAIVRYVTPGQPVLVEGKWGWMGVYLHDVDQSCYGSKYTYYRTLRPNHLLQGLDGHTAPQTVVK